MSSPVAGRLSFPIAATAKRENGNETLGRSVGELTDNEIIELLRADASDAMEPLFKRYFRMVLCIGLRILHNRAEAEDLVQEVFLYIFRKRNTIKVPANGRLLPWIIQLSYHRAFDRRDYLKLRVSDEHVSLTDSTQTRALATNSSSSDFSEWICRTECVKRALESLPVKQRTVISMRFYEGYDFHEVGQKIGESHGNVRNHYYRGLEELRRLVLDGS